MSLYILDTDHVSMWLENHPIVTSNVAQHEADLAIAIITVQEIFNGWMGRLNDPAQVNQQVKLYGKLSKVVAFLQEVRVLDFDETADQVFRQLLTNHPPLRKARLQKDMRIAAIAIVQGAIVITRNYRDFSQVPNLQIFNWSMNPFP
ncbi:type II toxin-antitoxin system VapC family toxin [Phormidesmis sp. 146-12]